MYTLTTKTQEKKAGKIFEDIAGGPCVKCVEYMTKDFDQNTGNCLYTYKYDGLGSGWLSVLLSRRGKIIKSSNCDSIA